MRPPLQLMSYNRPAPEPFVDNLCENIGPLGLKIGNLTRFTNPKEDHNQSQLSDFYDPTRKGINLEDPTHIYFLIEAYESLYERGLDNPYINAKYLIETLDRIVWILLRLKNAIVLIAKFVNISMRNMDLTIAKTILVQFTLKKFVKRLRRKLVCIKRNGKDVSSLEFGKSVLAAANGN